MHIHEDIMRLKWATMREEKVSAVIRTENIEKKYAITVFYYLFIWWGILLRSALAEFILRISRFLHAVVNYCPNRVLADRYFHTHKEKNASVYSIIAWMQTFWCSQYQAFRVVWLAVRKRYVALRRYIAGSFICLIDIRWIGAKEPHGKSCFRFIIEFYYCISSNSFT